MTRILHNSVSMKIQIRHFEVYYGYVLRKNITATHQKHRNINCNKIFFIRFKILAEMFFYLNCTLFQSPIRYLLLTMTIKLVIITMISLTYFNLKFGSSNKFILIDLGLQFKKPNNSIAGVLVSKNGTNRIIPRYKGLRANVLTG